MSNDLVLLKTFYHKHDAEMLVGLLRDAGIAALLQADDAGGFRHHLTLGMGNNRVLVQAKDAEKALEIVKIYQEELSDDEVKHLDDIAMQAKETKPASPAKKDTDKFDFLTALAAVLFILALYIMIKA
jgi:hypothetical protein